MKSYDANLEETVEPGVFEQWQEVEVEVYAFTDLGMKVAINAQYIGLVYHEQIYEDYCEGQQFKAYIQCVRDDGKIDVSLRPNPADHVLLTAGKVLAYLKAAGGQSSFNDKSDPEAIRDAFQVSKKVFKQAIGSLYKQGKITISDKGIALVKV